jgi:GAG-pre-integrase domain
MIGEGYLENNLYFLSRNKGIFCTQKEDLNKLWHKRVGHPSDKTLKLMFKFSNLDCSNYETCRLAKKQSFHFIILIQRAMKFLSLYIPMFGDPPP